MEQLSENFRNYEQLIAGRLGNKTIILSTSRLVVSFLIFPLWYHLADSQVPPNPVGHTGVDRKIERILHFLGWGGGKGTPKFTVSRRSHRSVSLFFIISCPTHAQPCRGTVAVAFGQSSQTVEVGDSSVVRGVVIPRVSCELPLPFFFLSVLPSLGTRPRDSCWKYVAEQGN